MSHRKIKVAVSQCRTLPTTKKTLQSLEAITKKASERDIGLLLFPEAFLGGYPRKCTFGSSIGHREDVGRDQYLAYVNSAIDIGDTPSGAGEEWLGRRLSIPKGAEVRGDGTREELERIAGEYDVVLSVGIVEKAGATLYCSQVLVDPKDGVVAKRRKVMPTATERLVWAQGDTSTLKATRVNIKGVDVTIGTAICWENFMPLLRYSLYSQGVDIYLAPTSDPRETWLPLLQTIASEGRTFVLSCNQVMKQNQLPSWTSTQRHSVVSTPEKQSKPIPQLRRGSTTVQTTAEGHEICLPDQVSDNSKPVAVMPILKQRKSSVVKAENGIEVCLPLLEKAETAPSKLENHGSSSIHTNGTTNRSSNNHKTGSPLKIAASASAVSSSEGEADEDVSNGTIPSDFVSRGGSSIVSPFGIVLAGPSWEKEEILMAEIDLDDSIRGKLDFDVAGHYSRSDAFKLTVQGLELSPP